MRADHEGKRRSEGAWAETIVDDTVRHAHIRHIASRWMRKDSKAATAWVQSSSLPPEIIVSLLSASRN